MNLHEAGQLRVVGLQAGKEKAQSLLLVRRAAVPDLLALGVQRRLVAQLFGHTSVHHPAILCAVAAPLQRCNRLSQDAADAFKVTGMTARPVVEEVGIFGGQDHAVALAKTVDVALYVVAGEGGRDARG